MYRYTIAMETTENTLTATARVATAKPVPYMRQLCKHFGHKTETGYDDTTGFIELGAGRCDLDAGAADLLVLTARAQDAEKLETVQRVIGSHLERFGRRDELSVSWD